VRMKYIPITKAVKIKNQRVKPFEGKRRYLATGGLIKNKIKTEDVDYKTKPSRADLEISENQLIVARMKGTNKVLHIDNAASDIIVSTGFLVLEPQESWSPRFLFHFFESNFFQDQKDKLSIGATQKAINNNKFKEIIIPNILLKYQERIVKILDAADALRQKRKQAITLLDDYLKSVFLEMFGDPVTNSKGWTIKKLGKICDVKGGKRIPKGFNLVKEDTGYPYIKAGNIKQGKILLKDLEYLTCELREKLKRYTVEKGDVCITVVGANIGDIGIVPNSLHMANLTENANKLLIKNKKELNNNYLTYYLMMDFIQNELVSSIRASGVPKLALFRIQQIDLLLPPISLQMKFSQILEKNESLKQKMLIQSQELETQFQALMQKAFKGEL
jgi:type I restriction enzyme S subunit